MEWILDIRPLLALRYGFPWKMFTTVLFLFLMVMTFIQGRVIAGFIRKNERKENLTVENRAFQTLCFLSTTGFLVLYLLLPNTMLLSERLVLFFFLSLITWLASGKYPRWTHKAAVVILVVVHIAFTRMYMYTEKGYSMKVRNIFQPGTMETQLNRSLMFWS